MQIEERVVGGVTILGLMGRMTRNESYGVLEDKINSLVAQGRRQLVINLAGVPYMDSTCVGEIVRTHVTLANRGGSLKLLTVPDRVKQMLSLTGLLTVVEHFDSEDEAVRSFSPPSGRA